MKKVSIITPCYNGEKFVARYLDSILNQTYKNIEMILINDGSTDKTEQIVLQYKDLFEKKGIEFIYIYQDNAGQAAALNKGLEIFTGDYLTWPDSDDILVPKSIERKVEFLESNTQYDMVRTDSKLVNEESNTVIGYFGKNNPNKYKESLFLDFIIENNVWFAPGCYLVRSDSFFSVIPQRKIYESRGGQNWQLLLPITYKYKCGYIDEALYIYMVRGESHSHSVVSFESQYRRCDEHKDILINTILTMGLSSDEEGKYLTIIEEKYLRKKLYLSAIYLEKELAQEQFTILKEKNIMTKNDYLYYLMSKNWIINKSIRVLLKIKAYLSQKGER